MWTMFLVTLLTAPGSYFDDRMDTDSAGFVTHRAERQRRPLMLGAELGINGLTGFGPAVSYTFDGAWSLDAALGLSAQLVRGGARARYTFLTNTLSPFIAIGAMYGVGTPYDLKGFGDDETVVYRVAGAPLGQAVAGVVYNHRNGFTIMGSLGWAQLLTRGSNVIVSSGSLSPAQLKGIRLAAGSGPVISVTTGYSF